MAALLIIVIALGLILRWHLISKRDLWDDEAASVMFAQLPWGSFLKGIWNYEANMAFYYLLLRGWLHFGDSEAMIRGLSVLFGVAVIPATYLLGKQLFGEKPAIVSAALAAVNVFQIRYSQEARGYSLVMLLSVLSMFFLVRAVEFPRQRRYWVGYAVVSALGVYTHIFFYLVVIAQWLWFLLTQFRRELKTIVWTIAAFILLTTPMDLFLLTKNQGQTDWVPRPTLLLILEFAKFFTGYGGSVLLAAYAGLCFAAVYAAFQKGNEQGTEERMWVQLLLWWLLFPIVSTIAVSFLHPIFYDRFMAISAPALVLLAGKGLIDLDQFLPRLRVAIPVSLALLIGLSVWGIDRYDQSPASAGDNWRLATRYIMEGQQAGDAAFFYRASGSRPFLYYSSREIEEHDAASSPVIIFPRDVTDAQDFNIEPTRQQAARLLGGHKRIWLILQHYEGLTERHEAKQAIQQALAANYQVSQQKAFLGGDAGPIEVLLYTRSAADASDTSNMAIPAAP